MTTMAAPTHNKIVPVIQAGGGQAISDVPSHRPYLSGEIQTHLQRVFARLCGSESTLSRDQLLTFLTTVQKQPLSASDKERYKFEEFMEFAWYNRVFVALKPADVSKDLSKPISNYFISSSHNTYLSGNQLSSRSSVDEYKNVLIRGCRCIEIDVWNGEQPSTPGHRPNLSTTLTSQAAAAVKEAREAAREIKDQAMQLLGDRGHGATHHRVPSISTGARESAIDLSNPDYFDQRGSRNSSRHGSRHSSTGARTEPRVLHGWTLTSEVGFRDVCKAIRETAFLTSDLPVIVSLEVHADLEQQEIMVEIMKEEWRGCLIDEAHPMCDPAERLPRLDELLNKILVKVKKATRKSSIPTMASAGHAPLELSNSGARSLAPTRLHEDGISASEDERGEGPKKKKTKICESLSRLGIYTHSEHFKSFKQKEARNPPHVFSIGEREILDLHAISQIDMFEHNRSYFMRAYPSGRRIDSSNPDPSLFWRKGVQMVALNWQSWDEGTMLNEGMFAGEKGWVLKPVAYRTHDKGRMPPSIRRVNFDLKVIILAGQHVPKPPDLGPNDSFHPFIKCELHVDKVEGQAAEYDGQTKEGKWKRVSKAHKSDHPDFGPDGCVLNFVGVQNVIEELGFLRIKVEDDNNFGPDKLAAWTCIRLDRLQQGYRFLKLLDARGQATDGLLLVRIEKTLR